MKDKSNYPAWLKSAIFYEIYPQSFLDTNGDGIGDLQGIIKKLDYINSLGCNAIWIHPCFVSPFMDAGYDVADYYNVAPRYGTNEDMKELIKEAENRDIKVLLDLVPGHTSIEHPWFKESCRIEHNEYSNRYIWTDGWVRGAGGFPNINGYCERNGSFITNFFWSQPALNFGFANPDSECPWQLPTNHPDVVATREELKNIMRFWLDMGIAGFRIDMAASLVRNDPDKKEITKLWKDVRQMLDKNYPEAVIISEWLNPREAINAGFHVDFDSIFSKSPYQGLFRRENNANVHFDVEGNSFFNKAGKGDASEFIYEYMKTKAEIADKGFVGFYSSNHDISRIRVNRDMKDIELTFAFLLTMPGVPFIYYGDEIGMKYFPDLPSKEGGYTRTGSRTPMQWSYEQNAGFSTASPEQLYLPIDTDCTAPNVAEQETNKDSLLNQVRKLAGLRRKYSALQADGEFAPLFAEKDKYPLVYMRKSDDQKLLIVINPSSNNVNCKILDSKLRGCNKILAEKGIKIQIENFRLGINAQGTSYGIYMCE